VKSLPIGLAVRFAQMADGKVIGEAIRACYSDPAFRGNAQFMEWLTQPKTDIWEALEKAGYCRLDENKVIRKGPMAGGE